MAIVHRGLVDQKRLAAGVHRAERTLAPDAKRIMFTIATDWTGEVSLFFRIILSDEASDPHRLREVTQRASKTLIKEIKAEEHGLQTYFNFRSESEQAALREPAWEVQ